MTSPLSAVCAALAGRYAIEGEVGRAGMGYVAPYLIAFIYSALGDKDRAFARLDLAYATRDPQLVYLNVDPRFAPLRSDPQFQTLRRKVGYRSPEQAYPISSSKSFGFMMSL